MKLILFCMFSASVAGPSSANLNSRMIGGTEVPDGYFPFMGSIRCSGLHIANAAVISETCVVTTAVFSKRALTRGCDVWVGSNKLNTGGIPYKVNGSVEHPNYATTNRAYNIGVLKFTQKIAFTDKIKPIRLAKKFPAAGSLLTFASWGETVKNSAMSNPLLYMNFTMAPDCSRFGTFAENSVICSSPNPKQARCNGDYGGPAFLNKELVGVQGLINVCTLNSFSLFPSISNVHHWIAEQCDLPKCN